MKKALLIVMILGAILIGFGCTADQIDQTAAAPSPSAETTPLAAPSASSTPSAAETAIESEPPNETAAADSSWAYYLDEKHPIDTQDGAELYELHRVKQDGSGDENLKIVCFQFDIVGGYIYADADLEFGDFAHWSTYRYALDGSANTMLEYADMTRYAEGDSLYFTLFYGDVIYVADTACNVTKQLKVQVPDEEELRKKIGTDYELGFITVTDQQDDWLLFDYKVTDTGPYTYYEGGYRVNLESGDVEKTDKGEFFLP